MNKCLLTIIAFVLLSSGLQGDGVTNLATSAVVVVPQGTPKEHLGSFLFSIGYQDSVEDAVSNLVVRLSSILDADANFPYFETQSDYYVFTDKALKKKLNDSEIRIDADFPISSADVFGSMAEMIFTSPGLTVVNCGKSHVVATRADHYIESLVLLHGTIPASTSINRLHIKLSGKIAADKPRLCEFHKTTDTTYIGIVSIAYYKTTVYVGERVFCEEGNYANPNVILTLCCDGRIVAEEPIHVPMSTPFITIDIPDTDSAVSHDIMQNSWGRNGEQ